MIKCNIKELLFITYSFHDDNNIDMDTIASQEGTIDNIYLDDEENVDSGERPERDDGELDFSH